MTGRAGHMDAGAIPGAAPVRPSSDEPTLDLLLAEPIVQQLMRRDRTSEAAIRHLLRETARLWRRRYDRELCLYPGMTPARSAVLIHLAQHEAVDQAALAHTLKMRPATLVRLLDRLEAAGLVARMPDPHDGRTHVLALTAKALPIIESIYALNRKTYDDLQLRISKAEDRQAVGRGEPDD